MSQPVVILLAAGVGRRMEQLSAGGHKALLPVGGQPIIDRIVDGCLKNGLNEFLLVLGHQGEELHEHLQNRFTEADFQPVWNPDFATTNNIRSLDIALSAAPDGRDLLLIEVDLVFSPDVIRQCLSRPEDVVAMVDRFQLGMDGTVVELDEETSQIRRLILPSQQDADFAVEKYWKTLNIHLWRAGKSLDQIALAIRSHSKNHPNKYYESVIGDLLDSESIQVIGQAVNGDWAELDDPNDHRMADLLWGEDARRRLLSTFGGWWHTKLQDHAFVRNAEFPTQDMIAEMRRALPVLVGTYGSRQDILDEKVADVLGVQRFSTLALSGVSQVYPILQEMFPVSAVCLEPTFGEYARWTGTKIRDAPGYSIDEVEAQLEGAKLAILCNPNNPTGTFTPSREIADLARRHPDCTFLIDESFAFFAPDEGLSQYMHKEQLENVIILTSLGKAFGSPGLRLGALQTINTQWMATIRAKLPIWGISSFAEFFLEQCMKHKPDLTRSIKTTNQERDRLAQKLRHESSVHTVHPSAANFLLVELNVSPEDGEAFADWMFERERILMKSFGERLGSPRAMFRVAVGTFQENQRLMALWPKAMEFVRGVST